MRAILPALLMLLLLAACATEQPQPIERAPENWTAENLTAKNATAEEAPTLGNATAADPCAQDSADYLLWRERNGSVIALRSLTLVDQGGWYKVTDAQIFARTPAWYYHDVTVQFAQAGSDIMDFNRKTVPIDPNNGSCFIGTVPLNISLRNLSMDTATITLGQGRNRNGREIITAQGRVDLARMLQE